MATAPFVIIPSLAAIAIGYPQGKLIADQALPRVSVMTQAFRMLKYDQGDQFRSVDTTVGRRSAPNVIEWSSSELTALCVDQGLDVPVPNADILAWEQATAAGPGFVSQANPVARNTKLLTQTVLNRREVRAANLLFGAGSYAGSNVLPLSGTSQWSDYTNSDPLKAILTAMDSMLVRPNIGVLGRQTATGLRSHPKMVKAYFGTAGDTGIVPLAFLRDLLELDDLLVGDGYVNTALPGLPPVNTRVWGKHAAFYYRDMQADTQGGVTFGFTAQWGDRIAGTIIDPDIGLRGGERVRVGESVVELITANDLGYLFQNAVA